MLLRNKKITVMRSLLYHSEKWGQGLFFILLLLFFPHSAYGIAITAAGSWTETINSSDLASGAGSNLSNNYESSSNATTLEIENCSGDGDNWRVYVRRSNVNWHNDLHIYVQRKTDGDGGGSISGGDSYHVITDSDTQFFSGAGNRSNIKLQYKLSGMSISVPPNAYSATITYTVSSP